MSQRRRSVVGCGAMKPDKELVKLTTYVECVAAALGLPHWRWSVRWAQIPDGIATFAPQGPSEVGQIRVDLTAWRGCSSEEKAQCIAHEVCHAHLSALAGAAHTVAGLDDKVRELLSQHEEVCVDRLAWTMLPLIPDWRD